MIKDKGISIFNVKEIEDICGKYSAGTGAFFCAAFAELVFRLTRSAEVIYINGESFPVSLNTESHGREMISEYIRRFANIQGDTPEMKSEEDLLCCHISHTDDKYLAEISFSEGDSETAASAFTALVNNMKDDRQVSGLQMISEEEKAHIFSFSCGNRLEYDKDKTWVDMFLEHAAANGEKTAVDARNGKLTYAQLDALSDRLAAYLLSKGIEENSFIAVKTRRVKEFAIAVLAINKIGAAYIPVDLEYPDERISYILENSEADTVLTEELVKDILSENENITEKINLSKPQNNAYMIYTSGSTGKPKGVVIQHKALTNLIHTIRKRFELDENSNVTCHPAFCFDFSIECIFPVLTAGGTLFIVPEDIRKDIFLIRKYLKDNKISVCGFPTQFAQLLGADRPIEAKHVEIGGEALTSIPKSTGKIYNTYGPAEFTVAVTTAVLEQGKKYETIPIGFPIDNTDCFVCDSYGNLLPEGLPGELCLHGIQMSAGYWKLPEKTNEAFVDCPFIPGEKMYRTGDLCRYSGEEGFECLGRIDFQVKIRGFRIELGEIESRAKQFPFVTETAALVENDQILLFYSADKEIAKSELCRYLAASLAEYMVPSFFIQLDEMPLTPNGKIDRKKLAGIGVEYKFENVQPENKLEKAVLDIARDIKRRSDFGVTDNLVSAAGFDSLSLMQLVVALEAELSIRYRIADVIHYGTIRNLLTGKGSISWMHDKYDPSKPVIVLVEGLLNPEELTGVIAIMENHFNVFVIEPIYSHYDLIYDGDTFDDVISFYTLLMELFIPEDARIAAIAGYSFAGDIVWNMADRWYKNTGVKLPVIIGDTDFPDDTKVEENSLTHEEIESIIDAYFKQGRGETDFDEYHDMAYKHLSIGSRLRASQYPAYYDGKTYFLNAHRDCTEEEYNFKLEMLHRYASDIEIFDFPDASHLDISDSMEIMGDFYVKFFAELAEKVE